ncbi:hypothetical protein JM93_00197 [Roseibium hamelinense]|uniref:Cyclic nucleotide-binding domain-containing protein n=1 Tax=Roseibium hamelinense TaxID=150831 RepID=A0A562THD4_9HYPH|nr:hypothetical protein [Roseibium hamelinense]MTI46153.1 hypothetical protein [Roseibium hamelinense]TWI92654.1 hypothetical protein JM93_00197 [Roseibium hamelinense]
MIFKTVDQDDYWTCLIRRGMLHSDAESVEHWTLEGGRELEFPEGHGVDETIIVLSGRFQLESAVLEPGSAVFLGEVDGSVSLRSLQSGALLSVRVLSQRAISSLPARVPELPVHERAL